VRRNERTRRNIVVPVEQANGIARVELDRRRRGNHNNYLTPHHPHRVRSLTSGRDLGQSKFWNVM